MPSSASLGRGWAPHCATFSLGVIFAMSLSSAGFFAEQSTIDGASSLRRGEGVPQELAVSSGGLDAAPPAAPGGAGCVSSEVGEWEGQHLRDVYINYDEAPFLDHWLNYADWYERHLPNPKDGKPLRLLEIGVQSGGSSRVWRKVYGPELYYVGVDINPNCKRFEVPAQDDSKFLAEICRKHGPFDVIIDDGGHAYNLISASLRALWNDACMTHNAVYAVEDLHVMTMCESKGPYRMNGCRRKEEFSELVGKIWYSMHAPNSYTGINKHPSAPDPVWQRAVVSIHLYDSLLFLHRGTPPEIVRIQRGSEILPYDARA